MSQFEQLLKALDEPVFEIDASGVVIYATPALSAWTDGDTGYPLADALAADDRPRFQQTLQRIIDGKTANALLEITLADVDGTERPIELKLMSSQHEGG